MESKSAQDKVLYFYFDFADTNKQTLEAANPKPTGTIGV